MVLDGFEARAEVSSVPSTNLYDVLVDMLVRGVGLRLREPVTVLRVHARWRGRC